MGPHYYVTPTPPSNGLSKNMLYGIMGIVIAILVGGALLFASSSTSDTGTTSQQLLLRLNNLYTYGSNRKYTRDLKNDTLASTNTELNLTLSTKLNTIRPLLTKQISASSAEVVASEKDTSSIKKLEAAKANNKLDREFRNILVLKIKSTRALIVDVYPSLKGSELKSEVKKTNEVLKTYQQKLEKITL